MATTVDIIIKGIAICYKKNNNLHVLFPVDEEECHKINFKPGDEPEGPVTSLAKFKSIEITAPGAISETAVNRGAVKDVYDLTSSDTHGKIRLKDDAGRFVLMRIPNAQFAVNDVFVGENDGNLADLVEVGNPEHKKPVKRVANSAKVTITLDDGGQVLVNSGEFSFATDAGAPGTLIFDNDCNQEKVGRNDMDMFYEVIEEFDPESKEKIDRQFRIGGVGQEGAGTDGKPEPPTMTPFKEPPNLAGGKTCLFAIVTDADSIKNLP